MLHAIGRTIVTALLVVLCVGIFSPYVRADDSFQTDYAVDYYLGNLGDTIATSVKLTTTITNKEDDVYIDKYSIAFPKSFHMSNIVASDDSGKVEATVDTKGENTTVLMQITDAPVGVGKNTKLYLSFDQENLFQVNGNVWEVLLPTMQNTVSSDGGSYTIRVHLPPNDKKLSIAKPKPDTISQDTITWVNPSAKTIIAVFGDKQVYDLKLRYHLENERLVPVVTDVAFPPNTAHQYITTQQIDPPPESVTIDSDGNYLGRYRLNPKQQQSITFTGQAIVSVTAQEEQVERDRQAIAGQQSYLTKQTKYWNARGDGTLQTPSAIYQSIVSSFSYNYDRVSDPNAKRLGAVTALTNPTLAVCAEFTDAFVSLARAASIPAREMEGYGFSQDERLRPQSLDGDVLHAWPEYWDEDANQWRQIDPTWENTSGIDYFNSFDLNHITFVIHGQEDNYPVPAGMYKIADSQDVTVAPTASLIKRFTDVTVESITAPRLVSDQKAAGGGVAHVQNQGNSFAYDIALTADSPDLDIALSTENIPVIAPYQTIDVPFTVTSKQAHTNDRLTTIKIVAGTDQATTAVTIRSYQKLLMFAGGILLLGLCTIGMIVYSIKKRIHKPPTPQPEYPPNSPIRPL